MDKLNFMFGCIGLEYGIIIWFLADIWRRMKAGSTVNVIFEKAQGEESETQGQQVDSESSETPRRATKRTSRKERRDDSGKEAH